MVEVGEKIPKVSLVDTELKQVNLQEAASGAPIVVAFFPGAFTGICTKEMCTFRDSLAELGGIGGRLYAVSVDGPFSNKEFKEKNRLGFTVLSDYAREAVRAFGVEMKDFAHLKGYTAAKRSVFIADKNGVIRFKWVTEDPTVEPNYAAVKKALAEARGK